MTRPLIKSERFLAIAPPVASGLIMIGLWELLCRAFKIPSFLIPTPSAVLGTFLSDAPTLLRALVSTMRVTFIAFFVAVLLGTCAAFLFVQSRIIERSLFPYAVVLQVTPVVAIAPLIIILVKNTELSLIICATIIAVFPIISNTTVGLRSIDPGLANLFVINKATRLQTLLRLRIPSALPYFFAGLRIASGLALIGAVVAEFVAGTGGRNSGLAYLILNAGFQLDIPLMFAALTLIAALGIAMFISMTALTQLALGHWHESALRDL